jgi:hypothetical protein
LARLIAFGCLHNKHAIKLAVSSTVFQSLWVAMAMSVIAIPSILNLTTFILVSRAALAQVITSVYSTEDLTVSGNAHKPSLSSACPASFEGGRDYQKTGPEAI